MPKLIEGPELIAPKENEPKIIREYIGRVNSDNENVSIAHMRAPEGWSEPGQRPEFTEYTVVLAGTLQVQYEDGELEVHAGQSIVTEPGEWIRYSTTEDEGAEYVAVCLPAFSPDLVNRDVPSESGE